MVDLKGYMVDRKGYSADLKGYSADLKGYSADLKGYSADLKGYIVDLKGYRTDLKGYRVDLKGYSAGIRDIGHEEMLANRVRSRSEYSPDHSTRRPARGDAGEPSRLRAGCAGPAGDAHVRPPRQSIAGRAPHGRQALVKPLNH
eukprot:1184867-Prorocentrum_minimum.AAC.1